MFVHIRQMSISIDQIRNVKRHSLNEWLKVDKNYGKIETDKCSIYRHRHGFYANIFWNKREIVTILRGI